ncbi:MAG: hypothetical protein ABJL99_17260 [Aliishimia sp.]
MTIWKKLFGGQPKQSKADFNEIVASCETPDLPQPFGYKTGWLALKASSSVLAAQALGAFETKVVNWDSGLWGARPDASKGAWVFLTPPVEGWVLVHIELLAAPDHEDGAQIMRDWLDQLSLSLGEAQYFGSYRVADFIAWMRSEAGTMTRGFAFVGGGDGTVLNFGDVTEAEQTFGFEVFNGLPAYQVDDVYADMMEADEESVSLDEGLPMQIAAIWSINPGDLGSQHKEAGNGLLARIPLP